jgi:hypothetical protein
VRPIYRLEYTHLPVGQDVTCIAGYYTPRREVRLKYNSREVLYVVGQAVIDSSCCGLGTWGYILVPGYIVNWHKRTNADGLPVTEVEPISDRTVQDDIRRLITEAESIPQVEFW